MIRLAALLLAACTLAACGIKGGLERPSPIWGAEEARDAERRQQAPEAIESQSQDGETEPGDLTPTIPPLPR